MMFVQIYTTLFLYALGILGSAVSYEEDKINATVKTEKLKTDSSSLESVETTTTPIVGLSLPLLQLPAKINDLRFMLYTRKHKEEFELKPGDKLNVIGSPFNEDLPIKIIIHGWQSSYKAEHIQSLKNALLHKYNANVILFDYKKYNSPYITAVSRAESIGSKFAEFLQLLMTTYSIRPEMVHIIGHSLGGHIAGFVGKHIKPQVARITAIDPAGFLFFDRTPEHRLSKSDAVYVDVIHTSTLAGINKAIGDADFFVNGGSDQPMCVASTFVGGCDHLVGFKYYEASLDHKKAYRARRCRNEDEARNSDFRDNPCSPSLAVMGDAAIHRSPPGIYYVPMKFNQH